MAKCPEKILRPEPETICVTTLRKQLCGVMGGSPKVIEITVGERVAGRIEVYQKSTLPVMEV